MAAVSQPPTRVDFPSEGGVTVAASRWDPPGDPVAVVQVTHGVGEYALPKGRMYLREASVVVAR